ncbi:MAG: AAA family ATPase [Bacteriovoracaceae bacterium]|nr:AAA family ATPase [Bacteriovoracaceae bacterium]
MFNFRKSNENTQSSGEGKVIAFMNQKGGVGKTTMAYNTARALSEKGHKVLCLDMDPQFNFSSLFGYDPKIHTHNIFNLMINSVRELKALHTGALLSEAIVKTDSGIDLIPSSQALSGFELTVAGINAPRQLVLNRFIEKNRLREYYDYIVIDGPPTLGLLVVNILCAVDGVLFPFIPDSFSEQGLKNIQEVLLDIEDMGIVKTPKNLGYIPNLFESRRKQANEDFKSIKEEFPQAHVYAPFSNKANFAKSMSSRKSVFDFQAKDYKELQGQFLKMATEIEAQL